MVSDAQLGRREIEGADGALLVSHSSGMNDAPQVSPHDHIPTSDHFSASVDVADDYDMTDVADTLTRAHGSLNEDSGSEGQLGDIGSI